MKTNPKTPRYGFWIVLLVSGCLGFQCLGQDSSDTGLLATGETIPQAGEPELRLNFRNVPLEMVLDYLSEAAGFIIMLDADIKGTVNIWSNQPMDRNEAIALLDSVLKEKGYAAVRQGRILKIVEQGKAKTEQLAVKAGNNPDEIPLTDEMITQIIPVRYGDAIMLLENLKPLLPEFATASANESSNAIILTDTQSNIKRMVKIIAALDTSISGISAIRVFQLQYSDAKELAEVVKDLFEMPDTGNNQNRRGGGRDVRAQFFERMRGGGDGDRGNSGPQRTGESEARQMVSRVVAVADERTNSLIVSAPEEVMPTIVDLVREVDTDVDDITEIRVFPLEFADAAETAELLTDLFDEQADDQENRSSIRFGGGPGRFGGRGRDGGASEDGSARSQMQKRVVAVPDARTNSVVVTAASELMSQIEQMIEKLDSDSSRKQKVFVYSLDHADVDNVAEILRGMFESQSNNRNRNSANRTGNNANNPLNNRTVGNQTLGRGNNQNIR